MAGKNYKQKQNLSCISLFLVIIRLWYLGVMAKEVVRVGVVLDLNSTVGAMAERCITMALSDFYDLNSHYQTRLGLFTRDSHGDVVAAASAVLDLIENEEVQAIIGPQRSSQAKFVIEVGRKANVPIISFSATSPSLSPSETQFFIRTAYNDSIQVKAITSLVKAYSWQEIIIIYEDTEYGNGLVPYLLDGFQEIGIRVASRISIPLSYKDKEITKELKNLKNQQQNSIFVVHMGATLGSKLFLLANNEGMMSEGYAWIVTQGLSTLLDPVDENVMESMQGVLGVRPYIPKSRKLENFKKRWINNLNLFGLWAYDAVWALAMAVENAGVQQYSSYLKENTTSKGRAINLENIGTSIMGPKILNSLLSTSFQGLSGNFHLIKRELTPTGFEIFNVIGPKERIIGYYTEEKGGFSRSLMSDHDKREKAAAAKEVLKKPIWPGDTVEQPKKFRIGVPVRSGFIEFMKVEWTSENDEPNVSGFCADIFRKVLEVLPFPFSYEFIPFANEEKKSNGTYDELLNQIKLQKFDGVVGDTTIVANRSSYVDFTLPYTESGVSMVVLMKHEDQSNNMWIFLKPLSLDLWLATALAFIFTGLVVWVLEHRINTEFRGPPDQQVTTVLWFSLSTLVFAHREKLLNNWTKFVVMIWIFVVLIISQSYTASLASMLTVKRLQPSFADIKEIQRNGYFVGYQTDSFVKDFLIKQLNFQESKLRNFTAQEYYDALSKGVDNDGGVAAIFDEIPYIKRFLAMHCSRFQMVGPIYKTDGFAFAFPLGSPLVSHFSRAILNVTEDKDKMEMIERKNFGSESSCEEEDALTPSGSLGVSSFGGLFIITGAASMLSLSIHIIKFIWYHWPAFSSTTPQQEGSVWLKIVELAKNFDKKDFSSSHHFQRSDSIIYPTSPQSTIRASSPSNSNTTDNVQNHSPISTPNDGENVFRDLNHDN